MQPLPALKSAIFTLLGNFNHKDIKGIRTGIMESTIKSKEFLYIEAMSRIITRIHESPSCSTSIKDLATKYQFVYEQSLIYKATAPAAKARKRKSRRTNVRRRRQTRRRILG
jgi:hypothetical protein